MKKIFFQRIDEKIIFVSDIERENLKENRDFKDLTECIEYFTDNYKIDNASIEKLETIFDESEDDNSLEEFKIKHWVSNRSFGELIDMYENDEIIVPNMQRNFVWDSLKSSRLIESIVLGLPIPPLFLLEVNDNKYELIDGYQRLNTLSNYVGGRPWNYEETNNKRLVKSRLSSKVAKEIANKSFSELDLEYKRKIQRSTIPLIEFKQLDPNNFDSKYLIFERINTGSVRLNPMQIRKSLSYGRFIEGLYRFSDNCEILTEIFTINSLKKDAHVEAILRIYCFYEQYYTKRFSTNSTGIKNVLNEFCEKYKSLEIDSQLLSNIEHSIKMLLKLFSKDEVFKSVDKLSDGKILYTGFINISIMEAIVSALVDKKTSNIEIDLSKLKDNYISKIVDITNKGHQTGINPFSYSTGSKESLQERFIIAKEIIDKSVMKNDI